MGGVVRLEESVRKLSPEKRLDVQHNDHPPPSRNYSSRAGDMSTCYDSKCGIGGQLA
jgi:hypothetical protein